MPGMRRGVGYRRRPGVRGRRLPTGTLLVVVAVGDGESETSPLATSWHSNKFLNAARDGAVLPILHLNGHKINNPSLLSRIPNEELQMLMRGYGWTPHFVRAVGAAAGRAGHAPDRSPGRKAGEGQLPCWR